MKKTMTAFMVLMLGILVISNINVVSAQDFMLNRMPSLYSDKRAFIVGDIVTILLMEFSSGSNESLTDTDMEHQLGISAAGTGIMDLFLQWAWNLKCSTSTRLKVAHRVRGL